MINHLRCVICFRKHLISQHEVGEQRLDVMQEKNLSSHCKIGNISHDTHKHCISSFRIATLPFTKVIFCYSVGLSKRSIWLGLGFRKGGIKYCRIKDDGTHAVLVGSHTTVIKMRSFCTLWIFPLQKQLKGATVFIIPCKCGIFFFFLIMRNAQQPCWQTVRFVKVHCCKLY